MITNRRMSLLVSVIVYAAASFSLLGAAPLPGVSPEDAKQIMPVSQVKRGMRGYGLTVFHGTKIENFDVEILGVLKQTNTGKDLILVRIGGGPVTTRDTGIVAGMSGSPCYIDGKLIGAISYGASFAKEPVGMITPIADMLEAWDDGLPKHASGYSSVQDTSEPTVIGGKSVNGVEVDEPGDSIDSGDSDGILHMQPLMTPLMVSGMSPRGIERLAGILKPFHISPVAGPGGGIKDGVKASLVPGAAIGVSLASGDIDMTGIGTVTYRRGNKIVAFGHPMLGIGAIDAPMTTAYVDDVLSSYRVSTKMASPIETVGRIFQDRPWSIAGKIGDNPKTIPATITVDDRAFNRNRTYHVRVINHPLLASRILTMVVGEAIAETHPTPGDATAEVSYEVSADQIGTIKRSNVFFDATGIDGAAISDIGSLLQILSSNKFYPLDIKSLNVKVRILDKRNTATVDRIFVKQSEYEPGETVDVGVVLRPYKKDRVTKTYSVKIPATAPDGKVTLVVRGGGTPAGMPLMPSSGSSDDEGGGGGPVLMATPGSMTSSDLSSADNVKQLVDKYLEREKNNEVVVQLMMRGTAINIAGEKLTGLPSAIADVMKSSRNSGLKMQKDEVKQSYPEDRIVFGSAQLSITVKRKDFKETKSPSKSIIPSLDSADEPDMTSSIMTSDFGAVDFSTSSGLGRGTATDAPDAPAAEEPQFDSLADLKPTAAPANDKSATKTGDQNPAPPAAKTDVKTVVRQPKTWSQKTQADFAKGTFSGVAASSENKLELAPTLKKLSETPEQFVWSLAPADDGIYAGTGDSGKVYHITDKGDIKPFYETGELEVHALARDTNGNIYAATSPHGKIFKISPDGKGKLLFKTDEKYVLALAVDKENNVYAGVGDAGKIYQISPNGEGKVFAEVNEQQILSLHWDVHGSLIVGTGINGVVYRVTKDGVSQPIFDAPEDSITAVVSDTDGNVYAGTSPKGSVYKITPDGRSKTVYTKATRVLSMTADSHNNIYAVSEGTLVKIAPDTTVLQLDTSQDKVQYLSVAYNEHTATLYAGTGSIGSIYISKCCDVIGHFESAVHDFGIISKWGRVKSAGNAPAECTVELQTRTGNVATPDSTWSDWSKPYTDTSGEQIGSSDARYVQYRATLKTSKEDVTPRVSSVTISYLMPNQPPTVKITAPAGGEAWAGKETITWNGTDPDKDTLTYEVFYSKDGKDWKALVGATSGKVNAASKPAKTPSEKDVVAKVKSELDKSKDVPDDMKKQVLKDQPDADKAKAEAGPGTIPDSSTKTSYTWETTGIEDGKYLVKVIATDRTANATGALTDEAISESFTVCNTPPKIALRKSAVEVKGAGSATINGTASSKMIEVVGVQFRVDGGAWEAAKTDGGAFGTPQEDFTVTTDSLSVGSHKVEVQAVDAAGNAANVTADVKVT